MCELFAMSSRRSATVNFSLEEFSRHGGLSGPHQDGWGIAYMMDRDARVIREPAPAATSPWVRLIEDHPIRSPIVLSHIRRATQGKVTLANTQPFTRELGGRRHVFAHNGDLEFPSSSAALNSRFRPLGDTDSERAFCMLLSRLEDLWLRDQEVPSVEERSRMIVDFACDLRNRGIANFLYTDGDVLFAHGHKRHQATGEIRPPGLHFLCRTCAREPSAEVLANGLSVTSEGAEQAVVLFASVPLTQEGWQPLEAGEVMVASAGEIVSRFSVEALR